MSTCVVACVCGGVLQSVGRGCRIDDYKVCVCVCVLGIYEYNKGYICSCVCGFMYVRG